MRTGSLDSVEAKNGPGRLPEEEPSSEREKTAPRQAAPGIAAQRLLNSLPVRPADILTLQRSIGNRAVQTLLARRADNGVAVAIHRDADPPTPQTTDPQPATPDTPAAGASSVTMGAVTVSTYDGLLAASSLFKSQLTADAAEVPTGEPSRNSADDLVKQEEGWEPFVRSKGTAPLDQAAVNQATVWYQAYTEARRSLETYKKVKARDDMNKAAAEADQARDALGQFPEQMAESQRRAFLAKDDALLEKITNTLGKALLASSALLEIHEKCMEMVGWLGNETTHVDELVEKFGPFAEMAHKAVAAYEGLSSALTILDGGEGATEAEQETSKASAGLGLTAAAGSLTGMASAYMLYFGFCYPLDSRVSK